MSTRGAVGFIKNGIEKIGYNHFDSYPTGLGNEMIIFLKKNNINSLNKIFDKITIDDSKDMETYDFDNHCFNKSFNDSRNFLIDSLFCEYAYIINLDKNVLEFYQGFNTDKNSNGRYASLISKWNQSNPNMEGEYYYGVKLMQEIPLQDIIEGKYKTDDKEGFILK